MRNATTRIITFAMKQISGGMDHIDAIEAACASKVCGFMTEREKEFGRRIAIAHFARVERSVA